jgi:outer membrane protein insertion porin family
MPSPRKIVTPILFAVLLSSCKSWDFHTFPFTHVKKFPRNKPFVYQTNIKLPRNLSKTEKSNLQSGLKSQLEDSVNPKASEKILWQVIKKPPAFDTAYVNSSMRFMLAMLHSSGYFKAQVSYDTVMKRHEESNKVFLNFNVTPGPLWHFDSVWYGLAQPELQRLTETNLQIDSTKKKRVDTVSLGLQQPFQHIADSSSSQALIKKGSSFSQDTIGLELDRLAELYRNNGYMRFTRNQLIAVWDTLDVSLLAPQLDPLEQVQFLTEAMKEKQNPTATLEIRLRPGYDSARLRRFYIGRVYIFPDFGGDTTLRKDTVVLDQTYTVVQTQHLFKPKILPQNIYFRNGQPYSQNRYLRTLDRFNSNIAWRFVTIDQKPRPGTDTVDLHVRLVPSQKYLFSTNLEGSRNDEPLVGGNLLGVGINIGVQNRNFARVAAQTNIALRYGTELGIGTNEQFGVYSRQIGVGYNIVFPKIIPHFSFLPERFREARTILAFNIAKTQRKDFYNLSSFNTSWGYELQRRNKLYALKLPNIEFGLLDAKDSLKHLFITNPGLKNLFVDGLVVSSITSFSVTWGTKRNLNSFKANFEESGILTSLLPSDFIKKNLYRFIRPDAEYKRFMKIGNNNMVARAFLGVGIPIRIDTGNGFRSEYLPFFKAYTAGGPVSMRGWGLRRLGPGHSLNYVKNYPDRFGDINFETNLEYRFFLLQLFGFKLNSTLFTDVGNVWFMYKSPDFPGGEFALGNFFKDLGIDVGTGLRLDLGFFLIRLDYALKVHNPTPEPYNAEAQFRYFYGWSWKYVVGGVLQFGVAYPF